MKKIILWILLIWFALVFAGSFIEAIMTCLYGPYDLQNLFVIIATLAISGFIVQELQRKLNVPSLFKRNESKD